MTIPVLLFLFSYFNRNNDYLNAPEELHGNITDEAAYMEVPDYINSAEYRMILEKTYIDLFDKEITAKMRDEGIRWLGYCHEDSAINNTSNNRSIIKSGDKIQWNGDTFCLPW